MKRVLLVGAPGILTRTLIDRFSRERWEVFTLTGGRLRGGKPKKVFEQYDFSYTSPSIPEVIASVKPEYVVFSGAYDPTYTWRAARKDMVDYLAGLLNILTSCPEAGVQRFVYLSSEEVFGNDRFADITEEVKPRPATEKALALQQGEKLCLDFGGETSLRTVVLRLDHVYGEPETREEVRETISQMCLAGAADHWVEIRSRRIFSALFANDAAEAVFRLASAPSPRNDLYHFSSGEELTEEALADLLREISGGEISVADKREGQDYRLILSSQAFREEFHVGIHYSCEDVLPRIYQRVKKRLRAYAGRHWWDRPGGRMLRAFLPYLENVAVFVLAAWASAAASGSAVFQNVDFYLFYILLFSGLYGKKQAVLSAFLASAAYVVQRLLTMSASAMLIDYGSYIWIAQTFILAMVVGYIRDRVNAVIEEKEEQERYLESQVQDIRKVNQSNLHLKNVMEERLISYDGSLAQLYEITQQLDQVAVSEVLYYAADIVSRVLDTRDVAIYRVDGSGYGRMMAAMSRQAKVLGKSIRMDQADYAPLMETFSEGRVYINKEMRPRLPMMASALQGDGRIRFVIMLWGLGFESMTLHQADMLTVLSYMIYHAADRSEQYWKALEEQRSVPGTRILREDSFSELVQGSRNACQKGLTEFTVLKIPGGGAAPAEWDKRLKGKIRETDYAGLLGNGDIGILLMNSSRHDAGFVVDRMQKNGIDARIEEAPV